MRVFLPTTIAAVIVPCASAHATEQSLAPSVSDVGKAAYGCLSLQGFTPNQFDEIIAIMTSEFSQIDSTQVDKNHVNYERFEKIRTAVKKCLIERTECGGGGF